VRFPTVRVEYSFVTFRLGLGCVLVLKIVVIGFIIEWPKWEIVNFRLALFNANDFCLKFDV
jgi:hypothetical protein